MVRWKLYFTGPGNPGICKIDTVARYRFLCTDPHSPQQTNRTDEELVCLWWRDAKFKSTSYNETNSKAVARMVLMPGCIYACHRLFKTPARNKALKQVRKIES